MFKHLTSSFSGSQKAAPAEEQRSAYKMTKDKYEEFQDNDLSQLINRLHLQEFNQTTCFLCARSLETLESTDEHVIPRWAQKRYNLWDQKLTLLNNTFISYRQLTVPCCKECNTYRLQPIEVSMADAVLKGPHAVRDLGLETLFLWLGKIFYGILYRELFLLFDRSANNSITIATPEMLQQYETHVLFLQQARESIKLVDFCPGSFFVFRTQNLKRPEYQWDFCDNIETMFIGIRMGEVGVIGILQDGGAQQYFDEEYKDLLDHPLHPIQFRELCAHFSYRSTLATRTPKYFTIEGKPHQTYQLPLGGFSVKPLFEGWDPATYAKFLSQYTGAPYERVFEPPDKVKTILRDEAGKPVFMDFNKYPFFQEPV